MQNQITRLKGIGDVKVYLGFLNYFAYRLVTNRSDSIAQNLLNQYIDNFYR